MTNSETSSACRGKDGRFHRAARPAGWRCLSRLHELVITA